MIVKEHVNPFFSVAKEQVGAPPHHDYYVVEAKDWVQIIVEVKPDLFLMIEQYRHAGRKKFIEFPGGVIDSGESPLEAAKRELAEETGYVVKDLTLIGENYSNPALLNNKIYTFFANKVSEIKSQKLDGNEQLELKLVSRKELDLVILNEKNHSLMLSSYLLVQQFKAKLK